MRAKKLIGAAVAVAVTGISAGIATNAASADALPTAPQQTAAAHGLGLDLTKVKADFAAEPITHDALPVIERTGAAPGSFDLTKFALSAGDQGRVGSCVTWATGYTAYGVLMSEQKISGAPMAPMFIYSQIARGNDQGTTADVALPMEQGQGIDTKSDYKQGDFDYTTQPTSAEMQNAAKYKLSGFNKLPTSGNAAKQAVMDSISKGMPVPIGFQVHKSFMNLNSQTAADYSYLPGNSASDPVEGGHEVTILAYNDKGVKIENSWGSAWGAKGYFTVPWKFFSTGDVMEVHAMGKVVQK